MEILRLYFLVLSSQGCSLCPFFCFPAPNPTAIGTSLLFPFSFGKIFQHTQIASVLLIFNYGCNVQRFVNLSCRAERFLIAMHYRENRKQILACSNIIMTPYQLIVLFQSLCCILEDIQEIVLLKAFKSLFPQNPPSDQQIPKLLLSLHVLLLHLCPVCALKAMFPALHTPVMDGMKCITAPRGALHQYNSPELTSSADSATTFHEPHRHQDVSAKGPNGKRGPNWM